MGKAATEYFEDGADIYTVVARLQMRAEELGEQAAAMVRDGDRARRSCAGEDGAGRAVPAGSCRPRGRSVHDSRRGRPSRRDPSPEPSGAAG